MMNKSLTKVLWATSIFAGISYTVLFFVLSIPRLFYPYELEWMEGSIAEHSIRILDGKQLYVRPSIEFVNWLYQPLYYYVSAFAMEIVGKGFFAGRIVSYCMTLLSASLIFFIVRKISGERFLVPLLAVSLLFASYSVTGYSFDIGRIDALLVFLILASSACLIFSRSYLSVIGSALFIALAFFTKQQAVLYIFPGALWLFITDKKRFSLFVVGTAIFIGAGIFFLVSQNGQWYQYYVFEVPRGLAAHGEFGWIATFKVFPGYIFSFWTAGTFVIISYFLLHYTRGLKKKFSTPEGLFAMLFLASVLQIALHSGDRASYRNVMLPFVCFMVILFPIALKRIRQNVSESTSQAFLFALPIQFVALFYNPFTAPLVIITNKDITAGKQFYSEVHDLPGDVYLPMHGLLPQLAGKRQFANELAMGGVWAVDDSISRAF
ncbi:MAG TPA: glycosyltransferase family 39 protein, partial [Candidatus Kapabacteria bacterium]|nr:glycosyltransferase family 39 protein [Candidatus Kapabacteria bacterium]